MRMHGVVNSAEQVRGKIRNHLRKLGLLEVKVRELPAAARLK
jgi:hypothetical protein